MERLPLRDRGFLTLFWGTAISEFGSTLSLIALPTFAVTHLRASASEVAAIYVVQWIPALFSTIPFGQAVDCLNRVSLVIVADLVAAGAALVASYLVFHEHMGLYWLLGVLFVGALCSSLYEIASQALVPQILARENLVVGNSRLVLGQNVAKIAGQGLSARLLAVNGGALVLLVDGLTFLIRAGLLMRLSGSIDSAVRPLHRQRLSFEEFRYFRTRGTIVRVIFSQATMNAGGGVISGVFLVYAYRTLGLAPYHIAIMLMAGSLSSVIASCFATRATTALGTLPTARMALLGSAVALWLIPLARDGAPFWILLVYQMGFSACGVFYQVCLLSYRQQVTPEYLQGRIASLDATINAIAAVSGLLFAALTANRLGPETGVFTGCAIASLSALWLIGLPSTAAGVAREAR